jgi:DNA-binding response OmpR family regulator
MVVEDDEEMNALERELLAVHGLDSVPAYTGRQAIDVAHRCNADAVLLDLMLPEQDGFETCRQLKKTSECRLPVVIVTALDTEDCREQGKQVGADAYFCKPFDPDAVVSKLRDLLESPNGNGHGFSD